MDKQLKKGFIFAIMNQLELYGRLKTDSIAQQKILTSKNARGLDEIVKKQEKLIGEIRKNEDDKKALFEKMAVGLGLKYTPELKLQDVLALAGDEDAADIDRETAKLVILMEQNASLSLINARLMKNYLDFIKFSSDLKERIGNPAQTFYTPDGIINNKPEKKSKFDQKI